MIETFPALSRHDSNDMSMYRSIGAYLIPQLNVKLWNKADAMTTLGSEKSRGLPEKRGIVTVRVIFCIE